MEPKRQPVTRIDYYQYFFGPNAIGQKLSISQNCQINFASKTLKI